MSKPIIYALITLLTPSVFFAIYWLGGGNFDRGSNLAATAAFSLIFTVMFLFAYNELSEKTPLKEKE